MALDPGGSRRSRLLFVALVVTVAAVASACQPARHVTWVDGFDGSSVDGGTWYPNRWFASTCAAGATSGEQQWYRPSAVAESGGKLVLTASAGANSCSEGSWGGTKSYSSGWAQTGGSRSVDGTTAPGRTFLYGRVDVRFRADAGRGLWPAIWLLAPGTASTSGKLPYPSRPEIDVLEVHGDAPGLWRFHLHSTDRTGANVDPGQEYAGPDTSTGYHTASVDWRADHITWFVDGVARWTYRGAGIPNQPMYLIVNLAVGGIAGTPDSAAFPAHMQIDSVQIAP
jgi:beta-glucanase (GH16 family)